MKTRGTLAGTGDTIQLKAQFKDALGNLADLNAIPRIQIMEPEAAIYQEYTSVGVYRINTGLYGYDFRVPINGPMGVWTDNWQGLMGNEGYLVRGSFSFVVTNTNLGAPNIDGYVHLGDEPIYNLSQLAIQNINHLMKLLRVRLQSSGRRQTTDSYGNIVYENCDIFSVDELYSYLCLSLSEFNITPHISHITFEDPTVVDMFADILVEGAYIVAIGGKALIEKGREFTITDGGVSFNPASTSDLLNSQFGTMLTAYRTRLIAIKAIFKPNPIGLGTLRISAVAPQYMRLRHRRETRLL